MEISYCPICGKYTGHKRALGWGTFFSAPFSVWAVPFYPKRCIICGNLKGKPPDQVASENITDSLEKLKASIKNMDKTIKRIDELEAKKQVKVTNHGSRPTKICPQCAEEVKAEAKLCRFCRYEFQKSQ